MTPYPNPANENLTVSASRVQPDQEADPSKDESILITDDLANVKVTLFDKNRTAVATGKFTDDNQLQFNTRKVPDGTYYVHIGDEKHLVKLQVIIQH